MKSITLALVAFLLVGLASADNYVGDAKGPDDPRASLVGYNQSQIKEKHKGEAYRPLV